MLPNDLARQSSQILWHTGLFSVNPHRLLWNACFRETVLNCYFLLLCWLPENSGNQRKSRNRPCNQPLWTQKKQDAIMLMKWSCGECCFGYERSEGAGPGKCLVSPSCFHIHEAMPIHSRPSVGCSAIMGITTVLNGTGHPQRDSRGSTRANHSQLNQKPHFS